VLVLVCTQDQHVLLIHRTDIPGFWQSVTGSVEAGETPDQTAIRELEEETGLRASPVDLHQKVSYEIRAAWRKRYAPDVTHNTEHWFQLTLEAIRPITLNAEEHSEYVWLPVADALKKCSSASNRAAIRRYIR